MADKIREVVTPIFTREMGRRLKLVREKNLLDQRELGRRIGVSAQVISKVEVYGGIIKPLTVAMLDEVFPREDVRFILFGSKPEMYAPDKIGLAYWHHKLRGKRKNDAK